jgi:hypothetical protein
MTDLEKIKATALQGCRLGKVGGVREQQFVDQMVWIGKNDRHRWLTEPQRGWLNKLCWKYREQLRNNNFGHVVPAQNPYGEAEMELGGKA